MIGQTLGHFRILSRLGSGGMGVVYRAHDEKLQRTIAIKVVGRESGAPAADRQRIIDEARAASGLSHPNICTVYETGDINGQAYIAMEYVEGRPLSESIPPGGLPIEAVVRYGIQIADALSHAHRRGVIHRDLKTANVVLSTDGRAKVLDFGLARRIPPDIGTTVTRSSDSISTGGLVGTLSYMAPEILLGQQADECSDIWGLGIMLYEMAAGELPFKGRNEFDLTASILRAPAQPFPPTVPAMVRAIIQRCLAKEPMQRYQHAGEVRAALEAVQSDVGATVATIASGGTADSSAAHPWLARSGTVHLGRAPGSRRVIVIAGAVVLAALVGAIWYFRDNTSTWERAVTGGRLTLAVASDDPIFDPAVSPDGKMLCYAVEDKDGRTDVFVRRLAGGSLVRITNDDATEAFPRFSPDGERVSFTRRESRDGVPQIRIVPALGGDAVATIPDAGAAVWAPEGRQLAFLKRTSGGNTELVISGIDGVTPRVLLRSDSRYPFLRDPAWSPNGQEIAIVRGTGGIAGEIWLIPAGGGEPRRAFNDPPEVFSESPAYTSDGLGLIHSSNRGGATNIWIYPRRGGAPVRLTAGPGPDVSPTVAMDGTITFINSRWRNSLDLHSLRGAPMRTLTTHAPFIWGPAFSPDGKEIAFSRGEVDGTWHLWTVPIQGGTPKRISDTAGGEVYSRYSPDSSFVLFHTWSTPRHIGRVPRDGGVARLISYGPGSDAFPDISPDGRWVAFTRTDQDAERIYVAPLEGGNVRLLTQSPGSLPRWSPDGRSIAFSTNRGFLGGIMVIDADGSHERRLTTDGGWPVWWPDGQQIGYLALGPTGDQEIHLVSRDGATSRQLTAIKFNGSNYPFDVSRDGNLIAASNAVHISDEIWTVGR